MAEEQPTSLSEDELLELDELITKTEASLRGFSVALPEQYTGLKTKLKSLSLCEPTNSFRPTLRDQKLKYLCITSKGTDATIVAPYL
jgi:hypothetical protein